MTPSWKRPQRCACWGGGGGGARGGGWPPPGSPRPFTRAGTLAPQLGLANYTKDRPIKVPGELAAAQASGNGAGMQRLGVKYSVSLWENEQGSDAFSISSAFHDINSYADQDM